MKRIAKRQIRKNKITRIGNMINDTVFTLSIISIITSIIITFGLISTSDYIVMVDSTFPFPEHMVATSIKLFLIGVVGVIISIDWEV